MLLGSSLVFKTQPRKILNSKGMTLIELMITISIIAVLAAIGIPYYSKQKITARRAECLSTMPEIGVNADIFMVLAGKAPCSIGLKMFKTGTCGTVGERTLEFPIPGIATTENSKMYFSYNVAPSGDDTATNDYVNFYPSAPKTRKNKLGLTFPTRIENTTDFPTTPPWIIHCVGAVTNTSGSTTAALPVDLDSFMLGKGGQLYIWQDAVYELDQGGAQFPF